MGRPNGPRDPVAGADTPEAPFPLKLRGPVIKGFGRGSKDLGIPTANIPPSGHEDLASGIYYGFCTLDHTPIASRTTTTSVPSATRSTTPPPSSSSHAVLDLAYPSTPTTSSTVFPAVLSVGYNLYYGNSTRSIEIHIMHSFDKDFYGATLSLIILGFIRPEYDYVSKEALVEDIREDIRIGQRSLDREGYRSWREDSWFKGGEAERGSAAKSEHGVGQRDEVAMCQME